MNYKISRTGKKQIAIGFFFFIFFSLLLFIYLFSSNTIRIGYNNNYQPDQAIPFSHKLHVGKYQMDCRYCHTRVEEGRHAGIPSLDICMNCHRTVKPDSPWIQKIRKAYENNQPIVWEKVHLLPDFVKFNHALHIKSLSSKFAQTNSLPSSKKQIQNICTTCHGKVENMEIMYQHESLSMGWCIQCHRKKEHKAPTNCTTCHY